MSARPRAERGLVALLLVGGCAVGPNFARPRAPTVAHYTSQPLAPAVAGGRAQRFGEGQPLPADWWRLLRCRAIDALVAEAKANNPGAQAALAALARSQNALRAGYGVFFPQADATLGVTRQQFTPSRFGLSQSPSVFNLFTVGATISYALDLWGGQRRAVEGLRAQAEAQRYGVAGTYLMLEGNVVNTAIAVATYREQVKATEEVVAILVDQVHLAEVQVQAGTVPYVNVLSLKSQLAATRATLAPLLTRLEQSQHLLAALVGKAPGEWRAPAIALADLTLPPDLPLSLPSQLVRQRPDILVAEAQLHAATAQIGVATAAMLPNLTLSANVGLNNNAIADLFSPGSLFWSVAAALAQPLFRGGTLWYQRKQALAAREQALANYKQTVIAAFQQVADALRALTHDAEAVAAQGEAVAAADGALRLLQASYTAGTASYLQLLVANQQLLQARVGLVQAEGQRFQDTVALFVALGGGWWNAAAAPRR